MTVSMLRQTEPAVWFVPRFRKTVQSSAVVSTTWSTCGCHSNGENETLLSRARTKLTGGSKLHLRIQETISHSGHYRVALAVNPRNELPPDTYAAERWTDRGVYSVWD